MHLLEYDRVTSSNYIKDLGEIEFDEKGILKTTLKTDDLKLELEKLGSIGSWNSKEGDNYEIFFVIESKETGIKFLDVEEKTRAKIKSIYPNVQSKATNKEKANFLFIDAEKDIVDVRFLDGNGNRLWKILEFGQPAKVHIQTRNMKKTKIKRQVFLNKAKGDDVEVDNGAEYTISDNELLILDINTNSLKNKVPERERKTVSMFYYVFKESDGDVFRYPKDLEISQKLDISKPNFYHHLKLMESPQLMNSLAATNAPLIVGEPLEMEQHKHEDGKCPRCEEDITADQLKKVYTEVTDNSLLIELANVFNQYKKKLKLDTCARKAHFFAQSIQEAGFSLTPGLRGESFNYYKDNLSGDLGAFKSEEGKRIAQKHGRQHKPPSPAVPESDQIILANWAYGSQYSTGKNFKNAGNDGWNFRGRGLLQITGRSNYTTIQNKINQLVSESGVDILKRFDSPSKAISVADGYMTVKDATITGMVDWFKDNMYGAADNTGKKSDNDVVDMVVDIINKKTSSREARKKHYQKTKVVFEVNNCLEIKPETKTTKTKYDIDKAVAHLDANAQSKSSGDCAKFVRKAINAGGITNIWGHAHAYYDSDQLVNYGFTKLGNNIDNIELKKGDIAAFASVTGHKYGHIAMYNGTQWVSDFRQNSFWVATAYSKEKKYSIYRWEN